MLCLNKADLGQQSFLNDEHAACQLRDIEDIATLVWPMIARRWQEKHLTVAHGFCYARAVFIPG